MDTCPVCDSTGFLLEESCPLCDGEALGCDDEGLVFGPAVKGGPNRGPTYCRSHSAHREQLGNALLSFYGRSIDMHDALVMPSGMTAIGAVMSSLAAPCGRPSMIVYGDELYCDVARTVAHLVEIHAPLLESVAVDIRDHATLRKVFTEHGHKISVFHFEACTNPSSQFFDFTLVAELRKLAPDCTFVVDNTWLSGVLFNPFDNGADLVVESLTKYVSAGKCIGGAVIGRSDCLARVLTWVKVFGIFIGADHCAIFLQGLETIATRVVAASANAMQVAQYLELHPSVSRVMYPLLASHPTHQLAQRFLFSGGPGCIWFHVQASKAKVLKSLGSLELKTSFGGCIARIDPWPVVAPSTAYDFPRQDASKPTGNGVWLRIALGYRQNAAEVVAAISALLDAVGQSPVMKGC